MVILFVGLNYKISIFFYFPEKYVSKLANVGSYPQGRIASDFLSGRTWKSGGEPLTENPLLPRLAYS